MVKWAYAGCRCDQCRARAIASLMDAEPGRCRFPECDACRGGDADENASGVVRA